MNKLASLHNVTVKACKSGGAARINVMNIMKYSTSKRDVNLQYDVYSAEVMNMDKPAVVVCHGLFGSKTNWQSLCKQMNKVTGRKVIAYDAVNHGRSSHHHSMSYEDMAKDLVTLLDQLEIDKAITIGHSMGGKTVMANALLHGDRVDKLVVVDAAPSLSKSMGEVKVYLDYMLHMDMTAFTSRKQIDQQLEKVAKSTSLRQFLMTNLMKTKDGSFAWRLNLQGISASYFKHIHEFPQLDGLAYASDTLFIGGGKSNYISEQEHDGIYQYFPSATIQHIPGAGHWVHAEKPKEFLQLVNSFIQ